MAFPESSPFDVARRLVVSRLGAAIESADVGNRHLEDAREVVWNELRALPVYPTFSMTGLQAAEKAFLRAAAWCRTARAAHIRAIREAHRG